jgi:hypothetical protein
MEDGSSIRKTKEEMQEEEEVAKAVNKTLAEEEKKRKEEEDEKKNPKDEKEKKKNRTRTEGSKKKEDEDVKGKDQDEACPPLNSTCPVEIQCPEVPECSPCEECGSCPDVDPCQPCGPCPPIHCQPCPATNCTSVDNTAKVPQECPNPVEVTMPLPVAIAVGATLGALVTGVAAGIGLLLRYASPIESGFVFLASLILMWYLSSHHPEVARELGGRVVTLLREATNTLGHRIAEAIRHRDQVSFPPNKFSLPKNEFHVSNRKSLH